jgi:hypothetical protein
MTDQERIRHIQEQANQFVSRNKCTDSSVRTLIEQAKATSSSPTTVSVVIDRNDCPTNTVYKGIATGGEYVGILQAAQSAAIHPLVPPVDTGVISVITLPTPVINMFAPPFTQQNLSTIYTPPCTNPGKRDYFPPRIYDGPGCTYTRITTPSG